MRRDKPLLMGWNRSPYTRRVAISMYVYAIEFDQRAQTAWDHYDDVKQFNPIVKIPALVTEEGEMIVESAAILDYLDCRVGPERALMPPPSPLRDRTKSSRSPPQSSTRDGSCGTRCICGRPSCATSRGSSDGAVSSRPPSRRSTP